MENNIDNIRQKLLWSAQKFFENRNSRLDEWERLVNSKKPQNILKMGFSLLYDNKNKIVKSVKNISVGAKMVVELRDGKIGSTVTSKERD